MSFWEIEIQNLLIANQDAIQLQHELKDTEHASLLSIALL